MWSRVLTALSTIVRRDGVSMLYRGLPAEMSGMIPKSSAMYATNEMVKNYLTASSNVLAPEVGKANTAVAMVSGFCSGVAEAVTVTPFQVVKVRMQTIEHLGRYKNSVACALSVVKQEGPLSMFIGLGPTCFRNCVWNTVYFGSMYNIKVCRW